MSTKLPLSGIRVANFGWGWLGPVAGQTLSRLGAEVYKIESYVRVDINRTIPPFATGHEKDVNCSIQNHAAWSGNGSVTINLKKPEGQQLARELAGQCDLVLENFGPGVMNKLNLDYEQLKAINPNCLLISAPAAGLIGALKNIRTYGMSLSSITGLDSITGYKGGPPIPMENAYADPLGGIICAFAAVLALNYHKRNGGGQHIDLSQQEGVMQLMGPSFMDYEFNGRIAEPRSNLHPQDAAAPHGVFPCTGDDRWISIAVANDKEWAGLVSAMESPAWAVDGKFSSMDGRLENIDELHKNLSAWTGSKNDYALTELLQKAGVAAAPVLNIADLLSDPHYKARETFVEVEHPLGFKETVYGNYVKTHHADSPLATGPVMGQDNESVFKGLMKMPESQYEQLVADKVIF